MGYMPLPFLVYSVPVVGIRCGTVTGWDGRAIVVPLPDLFPSGGFIHHPAGGYPLHLTRRPAPYPSVPRGGPAPRSSPPGKCHRLPRFGCYAAIPPVATGWVPLPTAATIIQPTAACVDILFPGGWCHDVMVLLTLFRRRRGEPCRTILGHWWYGTFFY